jgi:hypothetical protein
MATWISLFLISRVPFSVFGVMDFDFSDFYGTIFRFGGHGFCHIRVTGYDSAGIAKILAGEPNSFSTSEELLVPR